MFAIISILLIASATAFSLPPASISAPVSRDFHYPIEDKAVRESIETFTKLISNIQPALGFQDNKYLEQFVEGIASHFNAKNLTPYKFPQILKINRKLGELRVIQLTATLQVSTKTMTINGKYVDITQKIPQVFDVTKVCKKGTRRLGPIKQVCREVRVPRGLNDVEIARVNKILMDMVPQAQARLK